MDRLFSRFDLSQRAGYRDFLLAQAAAFLPIEAALDDAGVAEVVPDWPARRRGHLLVADLAALGDLPPAPVGTPPELRGVPRILGAAYVLEGSRLGGALLKRSVPPDFPRSFLAANAGPGSWRKFLEMLDKYLHDPGSLGEAASSAREVFMRFEAAAGDPQRADAA